MLILSEPFSHCWVIFTDCVLSNEAVNCCIGLLMLLLRGGDVGSYTGWVLIRTRSSRIVIVGLYVWGFIRYMCGGLLGMRIVRFLAVVCSNMVFLYVYFLRQFFCIIASYISFIVVQGVFCSIAHILTVLAATSHSPCSRLPSSSPSLLPSSSHHHLPCAPSSPPKYPLEVVSSPSTLGFPSQALQNYP